MANRAFIRFQNVTIANGATIDAAYVRLYASDSDSGTTVNLTLGFNDEDDPAAPTSLAELNALVMTMATVAWSPAAWSDGEAYLTPDIKTALQEIVNRAGWASGQDVILILEDNSSDAGAYRRFSAYDYDGGSEKPALFVAYTV